MIQKLNINHKMTTRDENKQPIIQRGEKKRRRNNREFFE
jgi:hypothetical protein